MKVALVNMPFAARWHPSIQLAICKTILNGLEVESDTFHLNLDYFRKTNRSNVIISGAPITLLLAEWVFARKLWGNRTKPDDEFEKRFITYGDGFIKHKLDNPDRFIKMRDMAGSFIDEIVSTKSWNKYDVVGFTCSSAQLIPSLCLAKHIKDKYPHIITMFGGMGIFESNAFELMSHTDWIDYMFIGEADHSLCKVMQFLMGQRDSLSEVKGVVYRDDGLKYNGVDSVEVQNIVFPDYSDFFKQIDDYSDIAPEKKNLALPYEMSRGCSYAKNKPCKFCSIEPYLFGSRSKDADVVERDINSLYDKWGDHFRCFAFTDLLSTPKAIRATFPRFKKLAEQGVRFRLESRPTLKPEDLRIMREGGLNKLFLGIESLHPKMIKLMKKGLSVTQSISTLKWSKHYRIKVFWNILIQIPFEEEQWYDEMYETIRKIGHFSPPKGVPAISIQRFGTYYQEQLLSGFKPDPHYQYQYPSYMNLNKIAYTFTYDEDKYTIGPERAEEFRKRVKLLFRKSHLRFISRLTIDDTRSTWETQHAISESQRELLKKCSVPVPLRQLNSADLQILDEKGLIIMLEGKALSVVEVEEDDLRYL